MPESVPEPRLQPGGILLHIGVHKTGTTAIQDAFATNREVLRGLGVSYPGTGQAHRNIASSAMQRPLGWRTKGAHRPDPKLWDDFVQQALQFDGITVCSSEFFAESSTEVATRIIERIGKENVHVVITLRNFAKILPSAWQQILKSGYEFGYIHWLTHVLTATDLEPKAQVFWDRHRHDEVVTRWANILGKDQVTVVVVDDSDRESIYRDFEFLTNLPAATLTNNRLLSLNRSMTLAEAELLRRINVAVGGGKGWKPYTDEVHDGLIKGLVEGRVPDPSEARLQTPQWALDLAAEHAGRYVNAIRSSGVNVMGNLNLLSEHLSGPSDVRDGEVTDLPVNAGVAALLGVLGTGQTRVQPNLKQRFRNKAKAAGNKFPKKTR